LGKFDNLSDLDFEELVADLAAAHYELPFRAGTRGADGGIDVLALDTEGREHVIQCKHYKDSSLSKLRNAAKKEAARLRSANATFASYRFATSRRLTHTARKELAEILNPWITSIDDVLGESDLVRLLRKHTSVEASHVKLWLENIGQLTAVLNAAAFQRSASLLEETRIALPRYVQTNSFFEARDILRRENVCVIAGTAGVGKTTLARLLMMDGLGEDFMPYEISPGELDDAWSLLSLDEKQLFYFDDFLGQTALHESRHADSDLLRLMRKISNDPNRRFVLATREYILRQARLLSEALDREAKDEQSFLLTIEHYSRQEKARIFYNHVFFSPEVDDSAIQSLVKKRAYLDVIDHQNYNPRLIEWITGFSGHRLTAGERLNYAEYCLSVLNSPSLLWTHAFTEGIGDAERGLLLSMLGLPRKVSNTDLELAFDATCAAREIESKNLRYAKSLKSIDDSFISSEDPYFGDLSFGFINPSVVDFLRGYLLESPSDAKLAIRSACFFEQVTWLWHALANGRHAPPHSFAGDFIQGFERTVQSEPPRGADSALLFQGPLRGPVLVHYRLRELLPLIEEMPILLELGAKWIGDLALQWLRALDEGTLPMDTHAPDTARRLTEMEVLEAGPALTTLKSVTAAMSSDLLYWECVASLRSDFPGSYSDNDWARLRGSFDTYLGFALEDPVGYLGTSEEVGSLEDLAETFGAAGDEDKFGEARSEIEELEADGEGDYDYEYGEGSRSIANFGESDEDIHAMFDRLSKG
jgi:hypothetical protein